MSNVNSMSGMQVVQTCSTKVYMFDFTLFTDGLNEGQECMYDAKI